MSAEETDSSLKGRMGALAPAVGFKGLLLRELNGVLVDSNLGAAQERSRGVSSGACQRLFGGGGPAAADDRPDARPEPRDLGGVVESALW